MAPTPPRLKILSVGGNAVSAFLSWRLSATNACDVTLVWKSGFDAVAQYGISFKSKALGIERFKPRQVVRTPEEAASASSVSFDYVLLCVKALPDVYDLASIIESVVTPQHTCILINTTNSLGVESYLEQRFPTNVVLSLVCGADLTQTGPSEFEHTGSAEFWVGPANKNPGIPASIQSDMAEALAMTLSSGKVDCKVSPNIRQQQYERMIGPIAFQPASVLFETPNHAELLEKPGVRTMISGTIDELISVAMAQGCSFPGNYRELTMEAMIQPAVANSLMYQDFAAKRPLEIETFLGSPMKLAREVGMTVPRIETLYALLHNVNVVNQARPQQPPPSPGPNGFATRMSSAPGPRGPMNGNNGQMNGPMNGNNGINGSMGPAGRGGMRPASRQPSMNGMPPMRRGPSQNGFPQRMPNGSMNGHGPIPRGVPTQDGHDMEEFSHVMLYDNVADGAIAENGGYTADSGPMPPSSVNIALRERELALREREFALRDQEQALAHQRRGPPQGPPQGFPQGRGRMPPPRQAHPAGFVDDDDEDGDDYFDPMAAGGPAVPQIDPDNFDMMSVTSRRTRKGNSAGQMRTAPDMSNQQKSRNPFSRPKAQQRTSARLMADVPGLHESLMNNAMMGYSSDRYGGVDRHNMGHESRTNSLTAERLNEMGGPYGPHPPTRRASQSPGHPLSPNGRPGPQRYSPPNGYVQGMQPMNGRPSPPGLRSPMPRHPPGHGNAVATQQVEQQAGVSNLYPPKSGPQQRSLTGSASASAGSGDSSHSARIDSEPSAHSSSSSLAPQMLGPQLPAGFR